MKDAEKDAEKDAVIADANRAFKEWWASLDLPSDSWGWAVERCAADAFMRGVHYGLGIAQREIAKELKLPP